MRKYKQIFFKTKKFTLNTTHCINSKLSPIKFPFDDGVYNATLRNSFFRYHHDVTIRLQEQNAVFKFKNTNF